VWESHRVRSEDSAVCDEVVDAGVGGHAYHSADGPGVSGQHIKTQNNF